jgi:hypothetical protein
MVHPMASSSKADADPECDERHPALEDHEDQRDAKPLPPTDRLTGSDRGGDGEGVQAQRKHEGQ